MKNRIFIYFLLVFIINACSDKSVQIDNLNKNIRNIEKELSDSMHNQQLDIKKIKELVDMYKQFIGLYKKDTSTPRYIYNLAVLELNYLGEVKEACDGFKMLYEKFPDFPQMPMALYTLGYIYNDRLKDYDNARKYYELLIKKYPKHQLVEQAKILLENVGKTDEELWEYIKNKNNIQDSISKINNSKK